MNDGTTLPDAEQETVVQNRVAFGGQTSSLSPDMLVVCASCGLANRAGSQFCKKCGANFPPVFNQPNPVEAPHIQPFMFPSLQNPQTPQNTNETAFFQPPQFTPPNASGQTAAHPNAKSNKSTVLIIGVLLGVAVVGAILWFMNQPNPLEAKLDKAISSNKLLEPAGDNAFDFTL